MNFPRRQHNATILPDGTVLVTGGTRGGGAPGTAEAFNDLDPGQPVHIAELWDPKTGQWTMLAAENTDRCYHSTAVLLPDGRVLSAGGGEFILNEGTPQQVANNPQDTHYDAQVFSPPYLFKGPQPQITSAPDSVQLRRHIPDRYRSAGADRDRQLDPPVLRDPFVQRRPAHQLPPFSGRGRNPHGDRTAQRERLPARALHAVHREPARRAVRREDHPGLGARCRCGPGRRGRTGRGCCPQPEAVAAGAATAREAPKDAFALRATVRAAASGTRVVAGITGICPYGIAACWGGANEALRSLEGVQYVDPIPDGDSSTATALPGRRSAACTGSLG